MDKNVSEKSYVESMYRHNMINFKRDEIQRLEESKKLLEEELRTQKLLTEKYASWYMEISEAGFWRVTEPVRNVIDRIKKIKKKINQYNYRSNNITDKPLDYELKEKTQCLQCDKKEENIYFPIIALLTGKKKNINALKKCIMSLERQNKKATKVLAFFYSDEFKERKEIVKEIESIFEDKARLQIVWTTKVYDKYAQLLYAKRNYPKTIVVTLDECKEYSSEWLEEISKSCYENPNVLYCTDAIKVVWKNDKCLLNKGKNNFYPNASFNNIACSDEIIYPVFWNVDENDAQWKKRYCKNFELWVWKSCLIQGYKTQVLKLEGTEAFQTKHKNDFFAMNNRFAENELEEIITCLSEEQLAQLHSENEKGCSGKEFSYLEKKIAFIVPARANSKDTNGDFFYARALKREFECKGYTVDFRLLEDWYNPFDGRYVIVFRGPLRYWCSPEYYNIMWNISHPEDVGIQEYASYDAVFIASKKWKDVIERCFKELEIETKINTMFQCTDDKVFAIEPKQYIENDIEVFFVGRRFPEGRKMVEDLLPTKYDLALYGPCWEGYIPENFLKGNMIDNTQLPKYYCNSQITLNDIRPEMKKHGFVSNRIFDIFAAGGFPISDYMEELHEIFGESAIMYDGTHDDLNRKVEYYIENPEKRKELIENGKKIVLENYTFKKRADQFLELIESRR